MPMGLLIMHWDDRIGVEILGAYPEEIQIDDKTLMQLYSQHEYTGEAGLVTLTAGAVNLASYYTGAETALYVILVLTTQEDGEVFEDGLAEITRTIAANMASGNLEPLLPTLFQRLSVYPNMDAEQKLANILSNDLKKEIILRLEEDVLISKSELSIWLKDQYKDGFFDLETELTYLIKAGLIKVGSIQGQPSEIIFLVRDLILLRVPPKELVLDPVDHHLPESLKESYINEVKLYFKNYKVDLRDSLKIANEVILDPEVYEVLKLLRQAIVTRNDIEKLRKKGVNNVDRVLKTLWTNKMILSLEDASKNEYFCLITDFKIDLIFPEYCIDIIKSQYISKMQNPLVLTEALEIMKEEYYSSLKVVEPDVVDA